MARFDIKKIKPSYQKGRIHVVRAEQHCYVKNFEISIDANEPKKVIGVVVARDEPKFKVVEKTGEKVQIPDIRELKKDSKIELKVGHRLMIVLDDSPQGIVSIDLSFDIVKYTGRS